MQPARRIHHTRNLTRLQRERRLLKLLLHVPAAEIAQVAVLARATAVRLGHGQLAELDLAALDARLVVLDDAARLVLGARDLGLAPAHGPARLAVLDEQVRGADLALGHADDAGGGVGPAAAVVFGHVELELVGVGLGGRLPSGLALLDVEVVGQVLGVGVPDFPVLGQAGVELWLSVGGGAC
jgi:hypothetical protein